MSSNDDIETFLREGIEKYYRPAKESVTTFETEIQEWLMRQFEAKLDWSNFQARHGGRGRGRLVTGGSAEPPLLWAYCYDEAGNMLELGIEWEVRETSLYTSIAWWNGREDEQLPRPPHFRAGA